ncbi:hypothetical protein K8O96_15330 [Clostridium sporogenes]|uniref:Resolvase HTH domain-containing protein n=1 Tax=Clostridium botulinum TaxID=1491 RepID=A0A6M0SYJ0_CLOBO|nr:hypothetical protein [Clostridium sporogenes]NFA60025.1 hypothetical protein [Clostridium botulinum]NFI73655.1 hypothetical protein [Clostridium sporogenes]NFL72952.1 hypothetical protein [Clostridium sporogenes]NFM23835.1 hypothetical protein [Clostridium sporogenes]NFP61529.1 hypothetical protein [Clostridium sporogenes]
MVAFLLIAIGAILILINFKAIKKEKGSFSETLKDSIENIDEYKEEMGLIRKEFAETLIDIQKEIEYLKKELNVLKYTYENNMEAKDSYKKNYDANYPKDSNNNLLKANYIHNKDNENISQGISEKIINKKNKNNLEKKSKSTKDNLKNKNIENDNYKNSLEDDNSIKVNKVNKLLKEGRTVEEICEILNIGKGEVILIKELYLK